MKGLSATLAGAPLHIQEDEIINSGQSDLARVGNCDRTNGWSLGELSL